MRKDWTIKGFEDCLLKVKKQKAVKSKNYLDNGLCPIVSQESDLISGYTNDEKILYKHEKPVVIFGDHTKNIKYVDFDFVVGADGVHILYVNDDILPKFFYYELCSIQLRNLGYARHYKLLKEKEIGYPNLSEQERIVSLLDEQFAKIDALKANAASQLQAAKDLFQSAINDQFEDQDGWITNKLGDICKISTGKRDANHAKADGIYRFYTCASQYLMCDTYTFDGDSLILPGNGANVGEVYTYSGKFDAYQRTYVLNHIKKDILHKYLYYYFLYKWKKQGTAKQYGAATNYIIMSNFTDFTVSFPSLPEQERIAARLDTISEKVKALQANYDQTINLCNDLKQSLLKSIFA